MPRKTRQTTLTAGAGVRRNEALRTSSNCLLPGPDDPNMQKCLSYTVQYHLAGDQ